MQGQEVYSQSNFSQFSHFNVTFKAHNDYLGITNIQWGSRYWPFEYRKHLNTEFFEVRISSGSVFKWSALAMAIQKVWRWREGERHFKLTKQNNIDVVEHTNISGCWRNKPNGNFLILLTSFLVPVLEPEIRDWPRSSSAPSSSTRACRYAPNTRFALRRFALFT